VLQNPIIQIPGQGTGPEESALQEASLTVKKAANSDARDKPCKYIFALNPKITKP
jgi:hypothetical protein